MTRPLQNSCQKVSILLDNAIIQTLENSGYGIKLDFLVFVASEWYFWQIYVILIIADIAQSFNVHFLTDTLLVLK